MSAAVASRTTGLALVLVAALSGCGLTEDVKKDIAATIQTPEEALTASAPDLETAPFAYTILGVDTDGTPQDLKGVASPAAKSYDMATSFTEKDAGFTMNMLSRYQPQWPDVSHNALSSTCGALTSL